MEAAVEGGQRRRAPYKGRRTRPPKAKPGKIDYVVATLGSAIARSDHAVGSVLPREAELMERLGASRSVIREAVKILGAKGLVSVGPRHGTLVRPLSEWNFLDRDVLAWSAAGPMARELLRSLEELRRVIEPAAAALAAERASPAELDGLHAAYAAMVDAQADPLSATETDKTFHIAILDATHNRVLGSFRSGLEAILDAVFAVAIPALASNLPNHEAVLHAIARRDPSGARAAMGRLLDLTEGYVAALERPSDSEAAA